MAKVVATYDTETKELSLTIDGEDKPGVSNFCAYSEGNSEESYGYFEATFKSMKENGVRYMLRASGSEIESSNFLEDYFKNILTKK